MMMPTVATFKDHLNCAAADPASKVMVAYIMEQIKKGTTTWGAENAKAATSKPERQCTLCCKYHTATKSKHPFCIWKS